jgi:four helix bundle protein
MVRRLQGATAMAGAKHFRDLVCWQLANELKLGIYRMAEFPPIKSDFRFRDQLIDAAASAPRNIAEGFGRRTHREFAQFLNIARGSLMECQNHLQDAVDRRYLGTADCATLTSLAQRTCGAVARLQRYLRGK